MLSFSLSKYPVRIKPRSLKITSISGKTVKMAGNLKDNFIMKLKNSGQDHILSHWHSLNDNEQTELIRDFEVQGNTFKCLISSFSIF